MRRPALLALVALALLVLALGVLAPGCDVRDSLMSVLLVRPVFTGDAAAGSPPAGVMLLLRSDLEEAAVRGVYGLGGPFSGIDYRTDVGVFVAREVLTERGQTTIDRVELRGQHTVAARVSTTGRGGAPAQRLSVAVVAVDRFSDAFTETVVDAR